MVDAHDRQLFTYADSNDADWQEFRPGSRRKVLHEDPATGQLTMLVQWDAGYRMGALEQHEHDEHLYILAGTLLMNSVSQSPAPISSVGPGQNTKPPRLTDARTSK